MNFSACCHRKLWKQTVGLTRVRSIQGQEMSINSLQKEQAGIYLLTTPNTVRRDAENAEGESMVKSGQVCTDSLANMS